MNIVTLQPSLVFSIIHTSITLIQLDHGPQPSPRTPRLALASCVPP